MKITPALSNENSNMKFNVQMRGWNLVWTKFMYKNWWKWIPSLDWIIKKKNHNTNCRQYIFGYLSEVGNIFTTEINDDLYLTKQYFNIKTLDSIQVLKMNTSEIILK